MTTSDPSEAPDRTNEFDEAVVREVISDLLDLHLASGSIRVGRAKAERLMMLHGLVAHTLNMVESALLLLDQRRYQGMRVLARVAYEHAVTAQWVHLHPEGLDALGDLAVTNYLKLFNSASGRFPIPDDVRLAAESLERPDSPPGAIRKFEQTCLAFDSSGILYIPYRAMTTSVHPGHLTLSNYVIDETGVVTDAILLNTPADSNPSPDLWALAVSTIWVSAVYEDIRRGKPNKTRVRHAAARLDVPTFLKLQNQSA